MLSLKLQRRVRQEFYKSEIPVGGGTTDVGVSICIPRRVIIVGVHSGVSIGGVGATVIDLSVPVTLRGRSIGRNYSIEAMQCGVTDDRGIL